MDPIKRKPGEILCTITIEGDHGTHVSQGVITTNKMLDEIYDPAKWLCEMTARFSFSVVQSFLPKWAATTSKRHK